MPSTRYPGWQLLQPLEARQVHTFLLFLLVLLCPRTLAAGQHDPIRDFCRRWGHQAAVIDDKLYIHGGQLNYNPMTQDATNYTNNLLLYHDLSTVSSAGMPPLYANMTSNGNTSVAVPSVSGGILWADEVNKRFYLFGGEVGGAGSGQTGKKYSFFGYDVLNGWWDDFGAPRGGGVNSVSYGAGISVSERGEGYYYGGWLTSPTMMSSGLVKYTYDTDVWTNNTGPDHVRRAEGVMVYIPAGDGGMLVYFGGLKNEYGNGTVRWQDMDEIFIYDVLSSKWYIQNATGDVPGKRSRFCGGVMWADDRSSYNVYIYGGASPPPSTSGYDDVYILTLPTFTWIKLYPNTTNATGDFPHHSLSCNIVNNAQMLIIGGSFPLSSDCDVPAQFGTHNLDLGQQNPEKALWQLYGPNLTTYAVPDALLKIFGGGPKGGATRHEPEDGFRAADLKVLMARKASIAERTPTRAIPSSTGTGTAQPGLGTGAIAGIAVGGAAVAILGLVGCCWFIKTRRKRHLDSTTDSVSPRHYLQPPNGSDWTPHSSPFPPSPLVIRQQRYELPAGHQVPTELQSPDGSYVTSTTPDGHKLDEPGRVWTNDSQFGYSPVASASPPVELGSPIRANDMVDEEGQWVAGSTPGSRGRVHQTYYHA